MSRLSWKFICLVALLGCGKEVEDVKNASVIAQQDSATRMLTINYQHSAFAAVQTTIPRNATFKILELFEFAADTTIKEPFHIYYNVAAAAPFHYEFKCVYHPSNEEKLFHLQRCYNFVENDLGHVVGVDFMLDEGKGILMQSQEKNSFQAIITHQVEWK